MKLFLLLAIFLFFKSSTEFYHFLNFNTENVEIFFPWSSSFNIPWALYFFFTSNFCLFRAQINNSLINSEVDCTKRDVVPFDVSNKLSTKTCFLRFARFAFLFTSSARLFVGSTLKQQSKHHQLMFRVFRVTQALTVDACFWNQVEASIEWTKYFLRFAWTTLTGFCSSPCRNPRSSLSFAFEWLKIISGVRLRMFNGFFFSTPFHAQSAKPFIVNTIKSQTTFFWSL